MGNKPKIFRFSKPIFNTLEQLAATKNLKKLWFFIDSNGVENQKENEGKHKGEQLNSLKENDGVKEQGLNETTNNSQEAIVITRRYEQIIKTQNKKAINK